MRDPFSGSHASRTDDGRRDVDEQRAARSGMGELLQCVWTHMEPDGSHVDHTGKKGSKTKYLIFFCAVWVMYKYLYSPLQESKVVKKLSHAQNNWHNTQPAATLWHKNLDQQNLLSDCRLSDIFQRNNGDLLHVRGTAAKGQILRCKAPPALMTRVLFYYSYIISSGKVTW